MEVGIAEATRPTTDGRPVAKRRKSAAHSAAKRRLTVYAGRIIFPAIILGVWELAVAQGKLQEFFVSRPSKIVSFLSKAIRTSTTWSNLWVTLQETLIGLGIATVAGIGAGLLFTRVPILYDMTRPYLTAVNSLPRIALAPLFMLWFGLGPASKVALVVSLCFFIVLSATMGAISNVDPDLIRLARVLGFRQGTIFIKVMLPWAVPGIFAGLELALVYAFVGAIAGEMIAAKSGTGQQIQYFSGTFDTTAVLGTLAILAVVTTVFAMLMDVLKRRLMKYQR